MPLSAIQHGDIEMLGETLFLFSIAKVRWPRIYTDIYGFAETRVSNAFSRHNQISTRAP
jgi:hypothetical protein